MSSLAIREKPVRKARNKNWWLLGISNAWKPKSSYIRKQSEEGRLPRGVRREYEKHGGTDTSFDKELTRKLELATDFTSHRIDKELQKLLADTYALQLKARNFHWNSNGKEHRHLRPELDREQIEMYQAVNELAERIHEKGKRVPGTFSDLEHLTSISEQRNIPSSERMVSHLKKGHSKVIKQAQIVLELAQQRNDRGTEKIASDRILTHRKMIHQLAECELK